MVGVVSLGLAAPAFADHGSSKGTPTTTVTVTHGNGATVNVQGIVQAVSASAVVVRQLDGSAVSVAVDRRTKVTIDGRSAKITDVKPGYVLVATVKNGQPATSLRFLRPS